MSCLQESNAEAQRPFFFSPSDSAKSEILTWLSGESAVRNQPVHAKVCHTNRYEWVGEDWGSDSDEIQSWISGKHKGSVNAHHPDADAASPNLSNPNSVVEVLRWLKPSVQKIQTRHDRRQLVNHNTCANNRSTDCIQRQNKFVTPTKEECQGTSKSVSSCNAAVHTPSPTSDMLSQRSTPVPETSMVHNIWSADEASKRRDAFFCDSASIAVSCNPLVSPPVDTSGPAEKCLNRDISSEQGDILHDILQRERRRRLEAEAREKLLIEKLRRKQEQEERREVAKKNSEIRRLQAEVTGLKKELEQANVTRVQQGENSQTLKEDEIFKWLQAGRGSNTSKQVHQVHTCAANTVADELRRRRMDMCLSESGNDRPAAADGLRWAVRDAGTGKGSERRETVVHSAKELLSVLSSRARARSRGSGISGAACEHQPKPAKNCLEALAQTHAQMSAAASCGAETAQSRSTNISKPVVSGENTHVSNSNTGKCRDRHTAKHVIQNHNVKGKAEAAEVVNSLAWQQLFDEEDMSVPATRHLDDSFQSATSDSGCSTDGEKDVWLL